MFAENPTNMAKAPEALLIFPDATSVATDTDAAWASIKAVAMTLAKIPACPNHVIKDQEMSANTATSPAKIAIVLKSKARDGPMGKDSAARARQASMTV
jgi:hypothetical protein